jgi:hypothetical protein
VCIHTHTHIYIYTYIYTCAQGTSKKHAEISNKLLDLQTNDANALIHRQPVSRVTHSRGLDPLESGAGAKALALAELRRQEAGGFVVESQEKPHHLMPPVPFLECREHEVLPQE